MVHRLGFWAEIVAWFPTPVIKVEMTTLRNDIDVMEAKIRDGTIRDGVLPPIRQTVL